MKPGRRFYAFLDANHAICTRIASVLPESRNRIDATYPLTVAGRMNAEPGLRVLDIGAGRTCHFAHHRRPELNTEIIGIDVDAAELAYNTSLDQAIVVAPGAPLPLPDASVDVATARSVVEHVEDVDQLLAECARVMKPGGALILSFPSKNAPFSWINRMLPYRLARRLLYLLHPNTEGTLGFRAYYHRCSADEMELALRNTGFAVERTTVSYYQSSYFTFFVPFFLASAAFETIVSTLRLRRFAATVLIEARRASAPATPAAPSIPSTPYPASPHAA